MAPWHLSMISPPRILETGGEGVESMATRQIRLPKQSLGFQTWGSQGLARKTNRANWVESHPELEEELRLLKEATAVLWALQTTGRAGKVPTGWNLFLQPHPWEDQCLPCNNLKKVHHASQGHSHLQPQRLLQGSWQSLKIHSTILLWDPTCYYDEVSELSTGDSGSRTQRGLRFCAMVVACQRNKVAQLGVCSHLDCIRWYLWIIEWHVSLSRCLALAGLILQSDQLLEWLTE